MVSQRSVRQIVVGCSEISYVRANNPVWLSNAEIIGLCDVNHKSDGRCEKIIIGKMIGE